MSWSFDNWVEALDGLTLSVLYRTFNRLIEAPAAVQEIALKTKGEQDLAWAVKHEFEQRWEAQGRKAVSGGVWE